MLAVLSVAGAAVAAVYTYGGSVTLPTNYTVTSGTTANWPNSATVTTATAPGPLGSPPTPTLFSASGESCNSVTTCSTYAIAVAANSVLGIVIVVSGTTTPGETVAVHGLSPALEENNNFASGYMISQIYGISIAANATVRPYVNFSASTTYTIQMSDFTGTTTAASFVSGSSGTAAYTTGATCTLTTTVANEVFLWVFGTTQSGPEYDPNPGYVLNDQPNSPVSSMEAYYIDPTAGSAGVNNPIGTTAQWVSSCIGILPAPNVLTCSPASVSFPSTTTVVLNGTTANAHTPGDCYTGDAARLVTWTSPVSMTAGTDTFTVVLKWQASNAAGTGGIAYPAAGGATETLVETVTVSAGGPASLALYVDFGTTHGAYEVPTLSASVSGA
jgi:hypothetical protein